MVHRSIKLLKSQSFFLFGVRGCGKTSLLKAEFPNDSSTFWIDLLVPEVLDEYSMEPSLLERRTSQGKFDWVIIDEVQRAPRLLDMVHRLIETKKMKFALTGSSARRLKQKGVNLLAGRAFVNHLFPFTYKEIESGFDLKESLRFGMLPEIFNFKGEIEKFEYLKSYALTYVTQEIQAEQWVRKLDPFRKFLPISAQMNGQILNYSAIARDVGVETITVQKYYEILVDTLLGFEVEPYHASVRKRQRQASKFYFIDTGIKRAFEKKLQADIPNQTSEFGNSFEHFIVSEVYKILSYAKKEFGLYYLQTKDGVEIDLVIEISGKAEFFVEIKSTTQVREKDFRGLQHFLSDFPKGEFYLVSQDPVIQQQGRITAIPWQQFLMKILN
jgi:uncharacterized protein